MAHTCPMDQPFEDARKLTDTAAPPVGYRSGESTQQPPVWQRPDLPENRWPVFIAVIAVIFLQRAIPLEYTVLPRWPLITLEGLLLMVLALINPVPQTRPMRLRTAAVLIALGLIAVAAHWPLIAAGAVVLLVTTAITPIRLTRTSFSRNPKNPTWPRPVGSRGSSTTSISASLTWCRSLPPTPCR